MNIFWISVVVVLGVCSAQSKAELARSDLYTQSKLAEEFSSILRWEPSIEIEAYLDSWFQNRVSTAELKRISEHVGPKDFFINRNRGHLEGVQLLRNILLEQESVANVLKFGRALRDHPEINPKLWLHAFISTKLIRPDMQFLKMPSLVELMPDNFFPIEVFEKAESSTRQDECILLDETFAADNGAENALWYFREDFSLNSHHWYWHIYHAPNGLPFGRADRASEMFAYMHHEVLSRYRTERMLAGLPRYEPIVFDYESQLEGYSSHLTDTNSGISFLDRPHNLTLQDIFVKFESDSTPTQWVNFTVEFTAGLHEVLLSDLRSGALIDTNGTLVPLDGFTGIDILSDATEATSWCVNPLRYAGVQVGGVHNIGHLLITYVATPTPDAEILQAPGVMASTSTSMRDPIFYRFHTLVENVYLEHKNLLTPYTPGGAEFPLKWEEIQILDLKVIPEKDGLPPNTLQTFWSREEFDFPLGLDYFRNTSLPPVSICAKHLDHVEFNYEIKLNNNAVIPKNATIRIFLARRYDENSNRLSMTEQRGLFFVLDQFPVTLSTGENTIIRNSLNSSLTIPFEAWANMDNSSYLLQNCGCGLPHYMLLPKGSEAGTDFDLFVMATDGVAETEFLADNPEASCPIAPLLCGLRGHKYPSLYPMGYPFDRQPYSVEDGNGFRVVENLDEYVSGIPNMNTIQIRIEHLDEDAS